MLSLDWRITLVVVVLTPLSLFAAKFIATRTYDMFKLQSKTLGEQTALVGEMLDGEKVVQAFSREEKAVAAFDEINARLQKYTLRATFFSSLTNPVTRFVTSIVYACVALAGALVAVSGGITVGGLSVFLSYANQYAKPFNDISGVVTELQPAGQLGDGFIKPRLDTEKRRHFRDASSNRRRVIAERLEAEGQLVPDLVGDDLVITALLDKADGLGLFALRKTVERSSVEENLARASAMRSQNGLQLPQKRRFSAARRTAEHEKLSRFDAQREVANCLLFLFGVRKAQIADFEDCHARASFRSRITGVSTSARYTSRKLAFMGESVAAFTVG